MISYKLNIQIFSNMYSAAITPSDTLNTRYSKCFNDFEVFVGIQFRNHIDDDFGEFLVMPYIAF